MIDSNTLFLIGGAVFSAGAAWGGAKVALNGTKTRVSDIKTQLEAHVLADVAVQTDNTDRLARIETKLDMILQK